MEYYVEEIKNKNLSNGFQITCLKNYLYTYKYVQKTAENQYKYVLHYCKIRFTFAQNETK